MLSLATPSEDPTGGSTGGGTLVTLRGVNFGTVEQGPTTLGLVSYSPVGLPLHFTAQQCSVTVDHIEIQCVTGPGVGARLLWTVTVDGLGSTYPRTSYQAPVITSLGILCFFKLASPLAIPSRCPLVLPLAPHWC